MIRKHSKDDEIPLTVSKSTILQETRARFDTLLKAALSHEDEVQKKDGHKVKKMSSKSDLFKDVKPFKKRSKSKLSTSTQMLVSEEEHSNSSEHEDTSQPMPNPGFMEVKDFTSVSSSDEILQSPDKGNSTHKNSAKTRAIIHLNESSLEIHSNSSSPMRPTPIPLKRHSMRDESRETTSSRVSSPDSVMTAIEAASTNRSTKGSTPEQTSLKGQEEYELKPLKGFSASYEEIDETNLAENEAEDVSLDRTFRGMENAASYEEILEAEQAGDVPERQGSDSNQGMSYESVHIEKKVRQSRKMKLQMSFQKRRAKGALENSDSSSNDRIQVPTKQKRHGAQFRRRTKATVESEVQQQMDIQYTYEKVIGITLHRCDTLKIDSHIRHPMVRVHILDTSTGEYLKKSQPNRNVSFFQEGPNIDYIQPLTSQSCTFKDPRSLTPMWEETLLFNDDIKHLLQPNSSILILFEILDCVPFDTAIAQYDKLGFESGWHRIAWAFLKPCGPNNILNTDKRLRLQLYKPRFDRTYRGHSVCDKCDVYRWWSKGGWIQYPSTLHVTVHGLPIPSEVAPAFRSYFALQPEQSEIDPDVSDGEGNDSGDKKSNRGSVSIGNVPDSVMWSRLPSQSCKIPNEKELNLLAGLSGSFSMKYSHRGHYLAVTATNQSVHSIYVHKIPDGTEVVRFQGHPGLVYSLEWSPNDELLLSASADCTACLWSVKNNKYAPMQMLPHPSFVYCAIFIPTNPFSLATGCCDQVIRIWRQSVQTSKFELLQELNGHEGYVSTICTNSSGTLFSGDSNGQIRIWERREDGSFSQLRALNVRELQGIVLSHLILHPGGKRLLVLARDSLLRMIDIGTGVPIQWFKGALNHRIHSKACITPCGGLVFSPSEDGTFYVWNADTGLLVASYTGLFNTVQNFNSYEGFSPSPQVSASILSGAVDYHPFEHMVSFAVYGAHSPVIVCTYKRESSGVDIGLQIKHRKDGEHLEADMNRVSKVETIARSALLMSNVKAHIRSKKDEETLRNNQGFNRDGPSVTISSETADGLTKQDSCHHLSYIIKQLDYVLQLSKASKQDQLDVVTALPPSPHSPTLSHDSSLQVSSRPSSNLNERENVSLVTSVKEAENEVTYSMPHISSLEQQQNKSLELAQKPSNKGDLPSCEVLVTSPVEIHYVQEKQPPRPAPRQKSSRQARTERRQSVADLSTTDTSLLSSENEDYTKSILVKPRSQLSSVNEAGHHNKANQNLPSLDKIRVGQRSQLFSSFDSESDDHSSKKE